jgi:hypothetical protein
VSRGGFGDGWRDRGYRQYHLRVIIITIGNSRLTKIYLPTSCDTDADTDDTEQVGNFRWMGPAPLQASMQAVAGSTHCQYQQPPRALPALARVIVNHTIVNPTEDGQLARPGKLVSRVVCVCVCVCVCVLQPGASTRMLCCIRPCPGPGSLCLALCIPWNDLALGG